MCNSCSASFIQWGKIKGIVHESDCPEAYKDEKYMCKFCGSDFTIESNNDNREVCSHSCMVAYNGFSCDCDECQAENEELYRESDYSGSDNDGFSLEESEED